MGRKSWNFVLCRRGQPAILERTQRPLAPSRRQARSHPLREGSLQRTAIMGGWTVASLGQFGPAAPGTNHDGCRSGSGDSDSSPANAVGSNPAGVEPTQTFFGASINFDEARNFLAVELPCCSASLPTCNANVLLCMSLCIARASHFHRGNFILKLWIDRRSIVLQIPAMTPDLF
jgi:hypothetical protein